MDLLSGVRAGMVGTDRLETFVYESGPEDGIPVVMIHGNLSTGRFYEHLWPTAPQRYRFIAPDMRSFGRSEPKPIDATRGLGDWADDTHALVETLGIERPVHLVGWSTGGAAIAAYAADREVASLTMIDPVSPYGFGGCHPDGTPCNPDWAGSGGGTGNPDFTTRLAGGDRSTEDMVSPRNVINSSYWAPTHREPPEREEMLLDEVLLSVTGDDGYPGDFTPSENWPGVAPGTRGHSQCALGQVLRLVEHRRHRPQAPGAVDSWVGRYRGGGWFGLGDGNPGPGGIRSGLAGCGGLSSPTDGLPDTRCIGAVPGGRRPGGDGDVRRIGSRPAVRRRRGLVGVVLRLFGVGRVEAGLPLLGAAEVALVDLTAHHPDNPFGDGRINLFAVLGQLLGEAVLVHGRLIGV